MGWLSQYMYIHPRANLHLVPASVSPHVAVLFTSLANGVKWAQRAPGLRMGDSIVILGPGQQGLACVLAASTTGANPIIVAGLKKDAKRLAMARNFGATHIVCSEEAPLDEQVKDILGPEMADVVVDASGSVTAQQVSVDLVRRGRYGRFGRKNSEQDSSVRDGQVIQQRDHADRSPRARAGGRAQGSGHDRNSPLPFRKGSRTRIGAGPSGSRAETYRSGSARRRDPSRGAQPLERLAVTENRGMQ